MKYALLTLLLMVGISAFAQSVNTPTMTLAGENGSAVCYFSSLSVVGCGDNGTLTSPALDTYVLPAEVATALEAEDIEDITITVTRGKISVTAEGNYECNIYDVAGRLVAMQKVRLSSSIGLERGIYVVAISREDKVVCARKVIVK